MLRSFLDLRRCACDYCLIIRGLLKPDSEIVGMEFDWKVTVIYI